MAEKAWMRRWDGWPVNKRKCRRKQRVRATWTRWLKERRRDAKYGRLTGRLTD